ncbi:hypothetical protein COOONC_10631 [Cooperia oncophora]
MANATPIRTSPDRTSMSSMGPLAMEVGNVTDTYTTEDEMKEDHSEEAEAAKAKVVQFAVPEEEKPEAAEKQPEVSKEQPAAVREHLEATKEQPKQEPEPNLEILKPQPQPRGNIPVPTEDGAPSPKVRKILLPPEEVQREEEVPVHAEKALNGFRETAIDEPTITVAFARPTTVTMSVEEDLSSAAEPPPKPLPPSVDEMEQVYNSLDNIEEALAADERYPMEGIEDFEERYGVRQTFKFVEIALL